MVTVIEDIVFVVELTFTPADDELKGPEDVARDVKEETPDAVVDTTDVSLILGS